MKGVRYPVTIKISMVFDAFSMSAEELFDLKMKIERNVWASDDIADCFSPKDGADGVDVVLHRSEERSVIDSFNDPKNLNDFRLKLNETHASLLLTALE